MSILELLHARASVPAVLLEEPAPEGADLQAILRAAVTAPDHGGLTPWRFLLIRGEARRRLGDVFAAALRKRNPDVSEAEVERQRAKPLRAPLIVVVVAAVQPDNPKVPATEQILSAGCAAQHMQLAANALGYGSIWLTGANAFDWNVNEALGLNFDDQIVSFLYLGTPRERPPAPARPDPARFVSEWTEPLALEGEAPVV